MALKNAYQQLFEAIVVGDWILRGLRGLEFVIRDGTAPAVFVTAEQNSSSISKLGCQVTSNAINASSPKLYLISSTKEVLLFKQREFLYQKYVVEGLSIIEISALICSSRSVVAKYLLEYGIPIRADTVTGKSQVGYGEAYRNHQVTTHKREQDVIEKMRKLRGEGPSYWKVAATLNEFEIPTKTRKGG